jgi:integrase
MANKTVTLVRYCKTEDGWKRLPIVMGANGKIRPHYAMLKGKPTLLPEGRYELRMYEGKKTIYKDAGKNPVDALRAQHQASKLLIAKDAAGSAGAEILIPEGTKVNLLKKKTEYVNRHLAKGQVRSSETFTIAIDGFVEATKITYADQVDEASVLRYYAHLRKLGNKDRTIYNKHVSLFGFFEWLKIDTSKLAERAPAFTEKQVEIFHRDDLKVLFDSCTGYNLVTYETLLKTGLRMREAMHLEWPNVDFRSKVIKVREMIDDEYEYDVRIKDRAERSVPLPDDLAVTLKAHREANPKTVLVLGTKNDTPNRKWLQMLKRSARSAELNCGRCPGCRKNDECNRWTIHKFRATYTTMLLRNGVDARTVMSYTGHEDLATVLRYLAPAEDEPMQQKVSAISWM